MTKTLINGLNSSYDNEQDDKLKTHMYLVGPILSSHEIYTILGLHHNIDKISPFNHYRN